MDVLESSSSSTASSDMYNILVELKPVRNSLLCVRTVESKTTDETETGLIVRHRNVDLFRIVDFSADCNEKFGFQVGDEIVVNSTGDEIEIDGRTFYLFKVEHVMAKVV